MNKHTIEALGQPQEPIGPDEILRRERAYLGIVGKLKPDHREIISDFASTLLEQDKYDQYKNTPEKRRNLQLELASLGINSNGVKIVMDYFNLSMEDLEQAE